MKFRFSILFFLLAGSLQAQNYVQIDAKDSKENIIRKAAHVIPTTKQLQWQELEVTGFLHYGMNTYTAREWGDGTESPNLFNPTDLDVEQWVKTAKEGGIKLLILTAKHHDGFCLWQTATTEHSVKSSPYKQGRGDVLRELADACRKHGMKLGVYLSPWDRNASSYGTEAYNDFFVDQLNELLTQYGKIDEVWFDGANGEGSNGKKQEYDWKRYYSVIREKQPDAVIAVMGPDVRWVGTETGYGRDTEWSVVPLNNLNQNEIAAGSQQQMNIKPAGDMKQKDLGSRDKIAQATGLVWYPAETDVSIRPGWFYHSTEDSKVKSPAKLMDIYFNSVGKNGVLLLNIPPTPEGKIHQVDAANLKKWNDWKEDIFANNLLNKGRLANENKEIIKKKNAGKSYWTSKNEETEQLVFEYDLKTDKDFNVLQAGEFIALGQRVEEFDLQAWIGGEWKEIAKGSTIGYKRILTFPTVKTSKVRFNIKKSRLNPQIATLGLYLNTESL